MNVLQMSIAGGLMVIAIAVARALFLNRLPKATFVALWALVALRLLVPLSIPSPTNVYALVNTCIDLPAITAAPSSQGPGHQNATSPAATTAGTTLDPQTNETADSTTPPTGETVGSTTVSPSANGASTAGSATLPLDHRAGVLSWPAIWASGTLVCTAGFILIWTKCRREFATSLPMEPGTARELLRELQDTVGLAGRRIRVRQTDRIAAPLTYGMARPVILMPAGIAWSDERERNRMRYALAHELTHIRRGDALLKLVFAAAVCVHWFNPLAWLMYLLANRDIELACDEQTVRRFGTDLRATYARALIDLAETKSGFAPLHSGFSKTAIEERVVAIMHIRKTSVAAVLASATLALGIPAAFATSMPTGDAVNVRVDGAESIAQPPASASEDDTGKEDGRAWPRTAQSEARFDTSDWADTAPEGTFTASEWEWLAALNVPDIERMTLSEAQSWLNGQLDTPAKRELLERFVHDAGLAAQTQANGAAAFVQYALAPLVDGDSPRVLAICSTLVTASDALGDGSAEEGLSLEFTVSPEADGSIATLGDYAAGLSGVMGILNDAADRVCDLYGAGDVDETLIRPFIAETIEAAQDAGAHPGVQFEISYALATGPIATDNPDATVYAGDAAPAETASDSGTAKSGDAVEDMAYGDTSAHDNGTTAGGTAVEGASNDYGAIEAGSAIEAGDSTEGDVCPESHTALPPDVVAGTGNDEGAASEESAEGDEELAERFAAFKPYGLFYEDGQLVWNGEPVNGFVDYIQTDETLFFWSASEKVADGIDVRTVYDDAGSLVGLREFIGELPF